MQLTRCAAFILAAVAGLLATGLAAQTPGSDCSGPCVWERSYGDGGPPLRGGTVYMLADGLPLSDGDAIVVGSRMARDREIWLTRLDETGADRWEATAPGIACASASIDDGVAVLTEDAVSGSDYGVLAFGTDGSQANVEIGLDFDAYGIAADGQGGFVVIGGTWEGPTVVAFDANGDQRWAWLGDVSGIARAVAALPEGGMAVLGVGAGGSAEEPVWLATLDDAGAQTQILEIGLVGFASSRPCEGAGRRWSVNILGDDLLAGYLGEDAQSGQLITTIARIAADGTVVWHQSHPSSTVDGAQGSLDEITGVSVTRQGNPMIAGFRDGPEGSGTGFVAGWDGDGNEIWRVDLRRPDQDGWVEFPVLGAPAETADGGVLAVMTDGLLFMTSIRAYAFQLQPDGRQP
ncbi:MAG: hypothetical protein AAFX92_02690 [Pseudomonadota bacterium]